MVNRKNAVILAITAFILSACGGGESSSASNTSSSTTSTSTSTSTSTGTTANDCSVISVLPSLPNMTTLSGNNISIAQNSGNYIIKTTAGSTVSIAGNSNIIKIDEASSVGSLSISGNKTTVIIGVNALINNFTISGVDNTIYLPDGTKTVIANRTTMAGSNQVKCYK